MAEAFIQALNQSIAAGWLLVAVLLLRAVLRRAPKWTMVLLWGLVALRLCWPFSWQSAWSLLPSSQTISPDILMDPSPSIHSGIDALNSIVNPAIRQAFTPNPGDSVNPLQVWAAVLAVVWLAGVGALLGYAGLSYVSLRARLRTAVRLQEGVFQSERVSSPFVLGVFRPRVYLPFGLDASTRDYVLAHERAHIRRRDHWWKPLGFLLVAAYWFHPLLWLGYWLLCRDIELACDESVVRKLEPAQRADYTQALLDCSAGRRLAVACPLAFGELDVRRRIRAALDYRKPALWIVVLALLACALTALCFLTDPQETKVINPWVREYEPGQEGSVGSVDKDAFEAISPAFAIGADRNGVAVFKDPQAAFDAFVELYAEGLGLVQREFGLDPITEENYLSYKRCGAQAVSGSPEALEQAAFVSQFLDIYENSFAPEAQDGGLSVSHAGQAGETLRLENVVALSKKGQELGWADFESYAYVETGSGLYIRIYRIDELFSLAIGGAGPSRTPMYIYLQANDGLGEAVDIREGGVEAYIQAHRDNPAALELGSSWLCSPVGYSGEAAAFLYEQNPGCMVATSAVKHEPVVLVESLEELRGLEEGLAAYLDLESSVSDALSFAEIAALYDQSFFETQALLLAYVSGFEEELSPEMTGVVKRDGILNVHLRIESRATDESLGGWLLAIPLEKTLLADVETVRAPLRFS